MIPGEAVRPAVSMMRPGMSNREVGPRLRGAVAKPPPVGGRRHRDVAEEAAPQGLLGAEAAPRGHALEGKPGLGEQPPRSLDAQPLQARAGVSPVAAR